ncbi:hypothetical protein BMS3Bbin01_02404 [bacterium BMS3Bbin01]|nr:hypothetical protein BMS3Bbin01_02404 [bacterium BMS3Bbin01]
MLLERQQSHVTRARKRTQLDNGGNDLIQDEHDPEKHTRRKTGSRHERRNSEGNRDVTDEIDERDKRDLPQHVEVPPQIGEEPFRSESRE